MYPIKFIPVLFSYGLALKILKTLDCHYCILVYEIDYREKIEKF